MAPSHQSFFYRIRSAVAHDGDTLLVTEKLGRGSYAETRYRVLGYDTLEIHPAATIPHRALHIEGGELVTRCVQKWLDEQQPQWSESLAPDKYGGRYLGGIWTEHPWKNPDADSLRAWVLRNGLGRPYMGDKKREWTLAEIEQVVKSAGAILAPP